MTVTSFFDRMSTSYSEHEAMKEDGLGETD